MEKRDIGRLIYVMSCIVLCAFFVILGGVIYSQNSYIGLPAIIDWFVFSVFGIVGSVLLFIPGYFIGYGLFPTFYEEGDHYFYRKYIKQKGLSADRISYISSSGASSIFGYKKEYDIYLKEERIPITLRFDYSPFLGFWAMDYPSFAKEILEKFPPEDFPPPGEKTNKPDSAGKEAEGKV